MKKLLLTLSLLALSFLSACANLPAVYTVTLDPAASHLTGKTVFKLNVVDRQNQPAVGLVLEAVPTMVMTNGDIHSTPVESIVDNQDGSYTVTAYYLMDSTGGSWSIKVNNNGQQIADLPVTVSGGMKNKATLKGVTDKVNIMNMTQSRMYFIFMSQTSGTAPNQTVDIFLATREAMLDHPAVYTGKSLKNETGSSWTANNISIQISADNGTTWAPMTETNAGHFTATGLTVGMSLKFKLTVNGEVKTTDGVTATTGTDIAPMML